MGSGDKTTSTGVHPSEWCVYDEDGPRTNNHIEGQHKMNKIGGKGHPNIYEVVELFKTEQAATEVTL